MSLEMGVVLILDDDPSVCRSLARLLGVNGYQTQIVADASELLSKPPVKKPACLILDLKLGKIDGLDLLRQIADKGHDHPIIVLTAYGSVSTAVEAMRLGADDFLEKPYEPDTLLASVSRALERSRQEASARSELSKLRARAARLTPRERQVIELVTRGMLNKEIADQLGLAEITVKIHRGRAMRRIGAHNAVQLAQLAALISLGSAKPSPKRRS